MTQSNPLPANGPTTGRLSKSEPEMQYFPGTREAIAQSKRLAAARQQMSGPLILLDFGPLERELLSRLEPQYR